MLLFAKCFVFILKSIEPVNESKTTAKPKRNSKAGKRLKSSIKTEQPYTSKHSNQHDSVYLYDSKENRKENSKSFVNTYRISKHDLIQDCQMNFIKDLEKELDY